jgi:hypothetical protein
MVIMHVPMVELLCQVVTRRILVLKYLLSGTRGCLWPCPIAPCIKCHHFMRSQLRWSIPGTETSWVWWSGAQVHPELGGGDGLDGQVAKSYLPMAFEIVESVDMDCSWV